MTTPTLQRSGSHGRGDTLVEVPHEALPVETVRWRELAEALQALAGTPTGAAPIHARLAELALGLAGGTTAAVFESGVLAGVAGDDTVVDDLRALAHSGSGEPRPLRQGTALARHGADRSVVLVVGCAVHPLGAAAGEIVGALLAAGESRLEAAALAAELARHQRRLRETQHLVRVGSWEWARTPERPGAIFDGGGAQTWSPMLFELLDLAEGTDEPSTAAFMAALHEDDRNVPGEAVRRAVAEGGTSYFGYRVPLADGSVRWLQGTAECELDEAGEAVRVWGTALDVTERRRAEGELLAAEAQFRLAMEFAPVGVALVGLDGRAIRVNRPLSAMLGRAPSKLVAAEVARFVHPQDVAEVAAAATDLIQATRESADCELRLLRADGSYVWTHSSASMLRNAGGEPEHVIVHVQDYTERREQQLDLERQASTDPLTGLMNRRGWESALLTHLDVAIEGGEPLAVGLLDLDHFKVYNDTFGHPAGDRLLVEVARLWTARLHEFAGAGRLAALARIGGEEFGVVLPGCSADEARDVVAELCGLTPRGQSTSGGVTVWSRGEDIGDTLARADGALYSAKRQGRRRVVAVLPA